jgi:hypothetical protein
MVQIVGNLEWELLKNVEIRKSIYALFRFALYRYLISYHINIILLNSRDNM